MGWLIKGDGSVFRSGSHFVVKMKCKDCDAVYAASRALSNVLGKKFAHPRQDEGFWVVVYYSKPFVSWWKQQELDDLKPFIEFNDDTMKEFIRGYLDSDGSVGNYEVYLCGSEGHMEILEYARHICMKLGLRVGRMKFHRGLGEHITSSGKRIVAKERGVRFAINATDLLTVLGGLRHSRRNNRLRRMVKGRRWTPWTAKHREEVIKLVKAGLSIRKAARRVGVPYLTAYFWVRRGTKTWQEHVNK